MISLRNDLLVEGMTPYFKMRKDPVICWVRTDDASNPPTDAELDGIFGNAADLPEGFTALLKGQALVGEEVVDTIYLCCVVVDRWYYEGLTLAA